MNDLAATSDPASPPSRPKYRSCLVLALWLGLALPGAAIANPTGEYGPEAEARFRMQCTEAGASAGACQALMERVQALFGYGAFLEAADRGLDALPRLLMSPADNRSAALISPANNAGK